MQAIIKAFLIVLGLFALVVILALIVMPKGETGGTVAYLPTATIATTTLGAAPSSTIALATETAQPANTPSPLPSATAPATALPTSTPSPLPNLTATANPTAAPPSAATVPTSASTPLSSTATPDFGSLTDKGANPPPIGSTTKELPRGHSEAAANCPLPLPVENIRKDFLEMLAAQRQAILEQNPDLVAPYYNHDIFVGQFWESAKKRILFFKDSGFYEEQNTYFTAPLRIEVNLNMVGVDGPNKFNCEINLFAPQRVETYYYKNGTKEKVIGKGPNPSIWESSRKGYVMIITNGKWIYTGDI